MKPTCIRFFRKNHYFNRRQETLFDPRKELEKLLRIDIVPDYDQPPIRPIKLEEMNRTCFYRSILWNNI